MMFLELVLSISLDVSCSSDIWLPGKMVRSSYTTYDHSFCGWHVWPTERDIEWVWGHHLPLARVHFLSWSCKSKHYFWTSDSIVIIDWPFLPFQLKRLLQILRKQWLKLWRSSMQMYWLHWRTVWCQRNLASNMFRNLLSEIQFILILCLMMWVLSSHFVV